MCLSEHFLGYIDLVKGRLILIIITNKTCYLVYLELDQLMKITLSISM